MKTEKVNYVLQALHKERINNLTKETLVKAFNEDGIFDLEGVAEHMLKRIKNDIEIQQNEPRLIDFAPLGKRTPKNLARGIVHVAPEVPFVLDGISYDPQDIRRFDGKALVFIPIVATDGSTWLQLFNEEIGAVIAGYFQMRQIESLLNPADFPTLFPPPPRPGELPPQPYQPFDPPGNTPIHHEPNPPLTWDQVQMFAEADYGGDWLWLAKGYMRRDLTRVSRGWFGDWNDVISSLSSNNTSCIYCEHINLEGSKLFLGPNKPIPHLSALGWNDRISSVWNFDS